MKTILVPIDFSKYAQQAVKASVRMAHATGAKIIFLHNVYTEKNWESLPLSKQMEDGETYRKNIEGQKKMKALMNIAQVKSIRASKIITYGVPNEQIVYHANRLGADLILMGSHANEGLEMPFIGSIIQKVLREATCPVLMVKKYFPTTKGMRIALACDPDNINHQAFGKIKKLLTDLDALVYLVFINRPADFLDTRTIMKTMDTLIKKYPGIKFNKAIVDHTDVAEGLMQFAEDNKVNCIVLITRNRKGKPKYLIGNTETLAIRSTKPVLSVNILPEPYPVN
jgi:nucleotide-binding universal stress UspA family protein